MKSEHSLALLSSARMSPHRVIPRRVARLRSPLPFHPVSLFRSSARAEQTLHPVGASTLKRLLLARQRQNILAELLADLALLDRLGDG
jgi:hypothetical protein